MDWSALLLSVELAAVTLAVLLPAGLWLGRWLAWSGVRGKAWIEAVVVLPLVLPPTVLGYYLLVAWGGASPLGAWLEQALGLKLTFTFTGLVVASVLFNVPFMVQPIQRAFEAIPRNLIEAATVSGLGPWQTFWRVELPLAWPGVLSAMVLTFVHTLGEFGVVLMVGGNIPGETRVISIAIYDHVEALEYQQAHVLAALLLGFSFLCMVSLYVINRRWRHER